MLRHPHFFSPLRLEQALAPPDLLPELGPLAPQGADFFLQQQEPLRHGRWRPRRRAETASARRRTQLAAGVSEPVDNVWPRQPPKLENGTDQGEREEERESPLVTLMGAELDHVVAEKQGQRCEGVGRPIIEAAYHVVPSHQFSETSPQLWRGPNDRRQDYGHAKPGQMPSVQGDWPDAPE
jgi:hypothetical protein